MAGSSPIQAENGHTRIAHATLEGIALAPFTAAQLKVVLFVLRRSWGWNRKDAEFSYADAAKATGLSRSAVSQAVPVLVAAGVIRMVREPFHRHHGAYRLQKDPRKWGPFACTPVALSTVRQRGQSTSADSPPETTPLYTTVDRVSTGVDCPPPESVGGERDPAPERQLSKRKERHTPTTPRARRASAAELDRLRLFLGAAGSAVDRMDAAAEHSPTWAAGILGLYGADGTDPTVWKGVPADDRPRILAAALDRYAAEAKPYNGRLFRRFLETVRDEGRGENAGVAAPRPFNRGERRPQQFDYSNPTTDPKEVRWTA